MSCAAVGQLADRPGAARGPTLGGMLRHASRWKRWTLLIVGLLLAGGLGLGWAAHHFFLSNAQAAARVAAQFEQRTGVGLDVGAAHWRLWPTPGVVLERLATRQPQPLRAQRIALHMPWRALLRRELRVTGVEIDGAVLQRESMHALGEGFRARRKAPGANAGGSGWTVAEVPVEDVRFRHLTWVNPRGVELAYSGQLRFDPAWRPAQAEVALDDAPEPATLKLRRQGSDDRWAVDIAVAGGSWNGETQLSRADDGQMHLSGRFAPRNIDVALLAASFKRHAVVSGRASGSSEIDSSGDNLGALITHFHTRTVFDMRPARIEGFDLTQLLSKQGVKAGRTPLDRFSGTVETQNGQQGGIRFSYSKLRASSGLLVATGQLSVLNRQLEGEAAIDLVDGVVGLPLKIDGTVEKPVLLLTGGAVAGAAVGTAVLPGAGTAIGARIGQQLERLLGDKPPKKSGQAPAGPAAPRR